MIPLSRITIDTKADEVRVSVQGTPEEVRFIQTNLARVWPPGFPYLHLVLRDTGHNDVQIRMDGDCGSMHVYGAYSAITLDYAAPFVDIVNAVLKQAGEL